MSDLGNKEVFAKNLKKYMDIKNTDRNKLASVTGFSYTTINEWYTATSYPRIDKIEILADYFGISKSDLIEDRPTHSNLKGTIIDRNVVKIPVLGKIPAGIPFEAIEDTYAVDSVEIPVDWLRGGKEYFALKITGDSMEPDYKNDDTVVFLKSSDCTSSQDCCVKVNGEDATFKRVTLRDNGILLSPLNVDNNTGFVPKFYSLDEIKSLPITVIGVAKRHIRDL